VASVQNQASPYHPRGLDDGVLALCEAEGLAFIAHSPLGGWRAGRIAHEPVLQRLARGHGATPHQIALAWLLAASPALIPIPGASRAANAVSSAAVPGLALDDADLRELDRTFRPRV
jgi:diketogulonate reductase-like aldo/keto reductase